MTAGLWLAVLAAFGFSLKAIFVKLAYAAAPVEAVTLLALRMAFALGHELAPHGATASSLPAQHTRLTHIPLIHARQPHPRALPARPHYMTAR